MHIPKQYFHSTVSLAIVATPKQQNITLRGNTMTKEPTIEEVLEFVEFGRDDNGNLFVLNVHGDVGGDVWGDVKGDVKGSVLGNVSGNVCGNVGNNVFGDVKGEVGGSVYGGVYNNA